VEVTAYYDTELLVSVKSFMVQATGLKVNLGSKQLFLFEIYLSLFLFLSPSQNFCGFNLIKHFTLKLAQR